jgi:hypothetical protein
MSWPFTDSPDYATTDDETGPDLRECPDGSLEGSAKELEGQTPRAVDCGRVAVLRSRRDPAVVVTARLFCKRKVCPGCGPYQRRRLAAHYIEAIGSTPVVRQIVDRSVWPTMAKRLRRHGASFLRIPASDGRYVVLATAGTASRSPTWPAPWPSRSRRFRWSMPGAALIWPVSPAPAAGA